MSADDPPASEHPFPATAYELPPPRPGSPPPHGLHLRTALVTLDGSIGGGGGARAWFGVLQVVQAAADEYRRLHTPCTPGRPLWRGSCRDPSHLAGYRRPGCTPYTPAPAP
jgi:hypothetical protein